MESTRPASQMPPERRCEMSEKKRLDTLLLEKGLETSRERAKTIIMQGIVYVNNQKEDKEHVRKKQNKKCNNSLENF